MNHAFSLQIWIKTNKQWSLAYVCENKRSFYRTIKLFPLNFPQLSYIFSGILQTSNKLMWNNTALQLHEWFNISSFSPQYIDRSFVYLLKFHTNLHSGCQSNSNRAVWIVKYIFYCQKVNIFPQKIVGYKYRFSVYINQMVWTCFNSNKKLYKMFYIC